MNKNARRLAMGYEVGAKAPLSSLCFEVRDFVYNIFTSECRRHEPIPQRTEGPCSYLKGERKGEVKLWN